MAAAAVWAGIPGGRAAYAETARGPLGRPVRRRHGLPAPRRAGRRRAGRRPRLLRRRGRDQPLELPGNLLHLGPVGGAGSGPLLADHRLGLASCSRASSARGARSPQSMPTVAANRPAPSRRRADRASAPAATPRPCRRRTSSRVPLHVLVGARSGDKGGAANVGLWADTDAVAGWLLDELTVDALKALLPEVAAFEIERHPLANLRAVNFVVHGILGWGVASNLRLDTQAKGLGRAPALALRRGAVAPGVRRARRPPAGPRSDHR